MIDQDVQLIWEAYCNSNQYIIAEMRAYDRPSSKKEFIKEILSSINIDNLDDDYIDDEDCLFPQSTWSNKVFYVDDERLADAIQKQYENAISRRSTYIGNLKDHLLSHNAVAYNWGNSYIAGQVIDDIFIISHFAPYSLREGYNMMKELAQSCLGVVCAVPSNLAKQLKNLGYRLVTNIPQYFNGEIVEKYVMVNGAVSNEQLIDLYNSYL